MPLNYTLNQLFFNLRFKETYQLRYDHKWSIRPRTAAHSRLFHYIQTIIVTINVPFGRKRKGQADSKWQQKAAKMSKSIHFKSHDVPPWLFTQILKMTNAGGKSLYRITCVQETIRAGNKLTQQLVFLHGRKEVRGRRGWGLWVSNIWIFVSDCSNRSHVL